MATVQYFQKRTKDRDVSGPDVVDLLASSTITHVNAAAPMAPPVYNPLPHAPHAHAHISRDGFEHEAMTDRQKNDFRSLTANRKRLGTKGRAQLNTYRRWDHLSDEGLHLDPATRNMMDPQRRIVDPTNKKGVVQQYIDRKQHSQFEDAEIAVMALVYSLNSEAAEKAMKWLSADGKRVAITSKTSANALNAGPLALKNAPKVLSAHPLRGKVTQVIERGKGASGAAPVPTQGIVAVVTVLDYAVGGELRVVTHFPISGPAPAKDSVEFRDFKNAALNNNQQYNALVFLAPVAVAWTTPTVLIGGSPSAGLPCVTCGTRHGRWTSTSFNPWYQCNRCGNVYCPLHGPTLGAVAAHATARHCGRAGCEGTTAYIY